MLLALLFHGLVLALLLSTTFSLPAPQPHPVPITSYLYQPTPATSVPATVAKPDTSKNSASAEKAATMLPERAVAANNQAEEASLALAHDSAKTFTSDEPHSADAMSANQVSEQSLVQRALNRAATIEPAAIDRDAAAGYQQMLLKQQQPKLTVDRKHWPVSQNPAQQVVAQLDDGRHIVRISKGVCVFGDPTLDGFNALMAARRVPCGDEINTSELLKQALDKHIKKL
tara:strand:+ start:1076 stop:1762 length:687 start_codon:yes stop_codon:yes gene_type:complete